MRLSRELTSIHLEEENSSEEKICEANYQDRIAHAHTLFQQAMKLMGVQDEILNRSDVAMDENCLSDVQIFHLEQFIIELNTLITDLKRYTKTEENG